MKKTNIPARLRLTHETVKTLQIMDLKHVVGGATSPFGHPTTTVLPTGRC